MNQRFVLVLKGMQLLKQLKFKQFFRTILVDICCYNGATLCRVVATVQHVR